MSEIKLTYNELEQAILKHPIAKSEYKQASILLIRQVFEAQKLVNVDQRVSPIFTDEEHRILKLLLASKIAEIQVNIVYDEPLDQRMGKVKLINILNAINEKVKIRC